MMVYIIVEKGSLRFIDAFESFSAAVRWCELMNKIGTRQYSVMETILKGGKV